MSILRNLTFSLFSWPRDMIVQMVLFSFLLRLKNKVIFLLIPMGRQPYHCWLFSYKMAFSHISFYCFCKKTTGYKKDIPHMRSLCLATLPFLLFFLPTYILFGSGIYIRFVSILVLLQLACLQEDISFHSLSDPSRP